MTFNRKYCSSLSLFVCLLATERATAQEINPGVGCAGADHDVNAVLRESVDQNFLNNAFQLFVRANTTFDRTAENGWDWDGGISAFETDVGAPFHKYVLSMLLVSDGVVGLPVPVVQSETPPYFWGYDDASFYLSPNHNLRNEYFGLAQSQSRLACVDVHPTNGSAICVDREPDGWSIWARAYVANPTYGDAEHVRLQDMIDGEPRILAQYSGGFEAVPSDSQYQFDFRKPVRYACSIMNDRWGVASLSATIVHENFHGTSYTGHVDCARGDGACAEEWSFDMPLSPRVYNGLPSHLDVDSYQVEQRFMCDVTEAASDWVPLMVQAVANARGNSRGAENIYQNIVIEDPVSGEDVVVGTSPLTCGVPRSLLGDVVTSACPSADVCVANTDCASSEFCNAGCCAPVVCTAPGGTTCTTASDCSAGDTCDANSCCAPLTCGTPGATACETSVDCRSIETCDAPTNCCIPIACPDPAGSVSCESASDCSAFELCDLGCCYPRPV